MVRLWAVILVVSALGCEAIDMATDAGVRNGDSPNGNKAGTVPISNERPRLPEPPPKPAPVVRTGPKTPPALETYAVCSFDILSVPRSQAREIDSLYTYGESAGIYGPEEKVLALNGLRLARSDMRFKEPFDKALAAVRQGSKRMTYVRLPEAKAQIFELGETLKDVSLFVWTSPDAVLGRHFAQARYTLGLRLEKVSQDGRPTYALFWQVQTGATFQRIAGIPSLDTSVALEPGQSFILAPTGVSGRSVDRALLTGVEESTVQMTCIVVTVLEARAKPEPKTPETPAP